MWKRVFFVKEIRTKIISFFWYFVSCNTLCVNNCLTISLILWYQAVPPRCSILPNKFQNGALLQMRRQLSRTEIENIALNNDRMSSWMLISSRWRPLSLGFIHQRSRSQYPGSSKIPMSNNLRIGRSMTRIVTLKVIQSVGLLTAFVIISRNV